MTSRGPPAVPSRPTSGPRPTLRESLNGYCVISSWAHHFKQYCTGIKNQELFKKELSLSMYCTHPCDLFNNVCITL